MSGAFNFLLKIILHPISVVIETKLAEWTLGKILERNPNLDYKLRYGWKSFWKSVRNAPIDVKYTFKIQDLHIEIDEYEGLMRELMKSYEFKSQKDDILSYSSDYGAIQPTILLSPALDDEGDENFFVSDVQIDLVLETGFSKFNDEINDLDKLKQEIEDALSEKLNKVESESLTCYLEGAYKLVGVPAEISIKTLYGELGRNRISLSHDKVIILGKVLSQELRDLKKIITYYY